ncbi:MAG TPA: hypothetical protein VFH78_13900 [Candidatus Thermoplasmatota archaeon]|nr:hypothetical protein [Candidatus Thermoplasmatota archaeon]
MWRALLAFVGVLLAVGLYALFTTAPAEPTPAAAPYTPGTSDFGFALAAGAIALAATMMVARPRMRFRR